jgi:hypothetical protein
MWSIDEWQRFGVSPTFDDNTDYYEQMTLSAGPHRLNYFDSYGDGWHGGYWEILPGTVTSSAGVDAIAGGPTDGQVTGSGGSTSFTLE